MAELSAEDRESLADFAEHADWCDYAEKSEEGCTPDFGCGVWRVRDRLHAAVETLIDRHVTAAVTKALNYAANDIELWRDLSRRRSDDTTRDGRSRSGALQRANAYSRAADIVRNQIPRAT